MYGPGAKEWYAFIVAVMLIGGGLTMALTEAIYWIGDHVEVVWHEKGCARTDHGGDP